MPAPFGPSRAKISFSSTTKLAPWTAVKAPYRFTKPLTTTASASVMAGEEGSDDRSDPLGLATSVGRADVAGPSMTEAGDQHTTVMGKGLGQCLEGGPDEGGPFHGATD